MLLHKSVFHFFGTHNLDKYNNSGKHEDRLSKGTHSSLFLCFISFHIIFSLFLRIKEI